MSKGSVRSWRKLLRLDCCDGALGGMSKGSVRSIIRKPGVDCCDRALRGMSKGSVRSPKKKKYGKIVAAVRRGAVQTRRFLL
jgi:hypothetical protein